jgi:hypothetical protein
LQPWVSFCFSLYNIHVHNTLKMKCEFRKDLFTNAPTELVYTWWIQKFPKFELCVQMVMSTSKYGYMSPFTPFLNQCGKWCQVVWLGLLLVNVFP